MTDKTYYITTSITYPNAAPHVGYAFELIGTDAVARFMRLDGRDVHFLTGTDEHGQKMVQTAEAQGMTARELANINAARVEDLTKVLHISNDDFIRTTQERHIISAQEIWRKMEANGDIYLGKYAGWYSVRDEAYYDESELSGGEGEEKLSPQGTPVTWVEEESYFFRLSNYGDKLLAYYDAHPDFIAPQSRRNEIESFVKGGLLDLSISRTTFDWGIPVPDAPGHVMYVWVDALTNYITGVGYPDVDSDMFKKFWPADAHVIGKDITRFHMIYWPAFLMSAGIELPRRVFGHGFLTSEGKKMSKSLGNVVDPFEIVDEFGVDPVRYYLLREVNFGSDGDFNRTRFVNANNSDLANDFGNLAQRSLSMIAKNCGGIVPEMGELTAEDEALLASAVSNCDKARAAILRQHLHEAVAAIWETVGAANKYFADAAPWALKKTDPARMETVLFVTAEIIRRCAIPALAFVPIGAARLLDFLAVPEDERLIATLGEIGMKAGTVLPKPEPVFMRLEREDEKST